MMMETYFTSIEDDFLDFYDPMEYADSLDSTCSNESDQENSFTVTDRKTGKKKKIMQRKAANQRERRRMKSINDAFDSLRSCIPAHVNTDRRLSKVDTLKLAIRYIGYLSELVESCSDISDDGQYNKCNRQQEKIIVRCHFTDLPQDVNENYELLGHSLSWFDEKLPRKTIDNKLAAKIWVPENPTEADLINLSSYSSSFSGCS